MRVEVYGTAFYFFALNKNGNPVRDEYIVYDINSWMQTPDYEVALQQMKMNSFSSHIIDSARRHHTFVSTSDNGAQINATLAFYDGCDCSSTHQIRKIRFPLTQHSVTER